MSVAQFFDLNIGTLPDELPVLALSEGFLLPEGKLSIRMTDIKQIAQVFFALSHGRVFAVLPKSAQTLLKIGCVGRICGFNENDDGSLTLSLTGVCRFDVSSYFSKDSYEMAKVDFLRFSQDFESINMEKESVLLETLKTYLYNRHIDIDVHLFLKMTCRRLLATLVSILPLDFMEKQAVFECVDFNESVQVLITILKMSLTDEILDKGKQKC